LGDGVSSLVLPQRAGAAVESYGENGDIVTRDVFWLFGPDGLSPPLEIFPGEEAESEKGSLPEGASLQVDPFLEALSPGLETVSGKQDPSRVEDILRKVLHHCSGGTGGDTGEAEVGIERSLDGLKKAQGHDRSRFGDDRLDETRSQGRYEPRERPPQRLLERRQAGKNVKATNFGHTPPLRAASACRRHASCKRSSSLRAAAAVSSARFAASRVRALAANRSIGPSPSGPDWKRRAVSRSRVSIARPTAFRA